MSKTDQSAFAKAAQAVLDEYGDDPEACADKIKALAKVFADDGAAPKKKKKSGGKYTKGKISEADAEKIKTYLAENNGDYEGAEKKFKRKAATLKEKFTEKGNDRKAKGD